MFLFPAPVTVSRSPVSTSLLDPFFSDRVGATAAATRVPPMDVAETETGFLLTFDVPGVTREQLRLAVHGRRVELESAAAEAPAQVEGQRLLYRERTDTRYARTVVLPVEVDTAGSSAKFDNGVLTVSLSKKLAPAATQIAIG